MIVFRPSARARRRAAGAVLITAVLASLLAACVAPPTAEPTSTATSTPTPTPPANSLTAARIAEITEQQCPATVAADVLSELPESAANAIDFMAATAQCGLIALVTQAPAQPATFVSPLQYTAPCASAATVTVWAHYDDDLIFGSPTIPNALAAGQCIRTLFITGSDAGKGPEYAANRERGIRAAYDVIRGAEGEWADMTVGLRSGLTITTTSPVGDARVALLFVRLPDGGLDSSGFSATGNQALPQLLSGALEAITTIDTGQQVTLAALEATVAEVVTAYAPQAVLAHMPAVSPLAHGDHPDHSATGTLVANLVDRGVVESAKVQYAVGYPSEWNGVNLGGDELQRKLEAFAAYASHDSVLKCSTAESCLNVRKFGAWLQRQYLVPDADVAR
ncbi:PIG-L family deacetylase [Microbacterium sp. LWO13-1.2]|uniref:PIG-L family deacetylase n=1 Tax=Microbacterium sp. LWO13-1.2 TaxID=3135262 RepID=UPI0031387D0E